MLRPEINVTPLIDVLLVLLIIFMVVTPTRPSAFRTRVPEKPTRAPGIESNPYTLIVSIAADGCLHLNREVLDATPVSPAALTERLRAIFEERFVNGAFLPNNSPSGGPSIERTVFIRAPRSLAYGSVAKVVDAIKLSGAEPVALQIDELD